MVDLPKRNPIRGGPTYKPGESLLGTVGRVVTQDLPSLAGRIGRAWTAGARPATAGPQGTTQPAPAPSSGVPTPGLPPGYQGVAGRHSGPSPDLLKARKSIRGIESYGGNPRAVGPITKSGDRAYGADQVMGANIPKWSAPFTGDEKTTPKEFLDRPDLQNKVFNKQFGDTAKRLGPPGKPDYPGASTWWFTGKDPDKVNPKAKDVVGTTPPKYKAKFIAGFGEEKLDEFKSPWAGIDKAAADTARWRKNREEGKQAVPIEKKSGWLRGAVKDYMSAKYGMKKEETLDEIYPPMWAGYPAHMEKLRKERAEKKKADQEKPKEKDVKEGKTQTSPGVESEEHPKKFELPEKYDGAHSVRNIYMESAAGFYGGGGAGGHSVAASPTRQAPRPAARPTARPQAAAAPVAKPAAPTAPAAAPTPTPGPTLSTPAPAVSKPTGTPGFNTIAPPTAAPTPFSPKADIAGGTNVPERFRMAGAGGGYQAAPAAPAAAAPTPKPQATAVPIAQKAEPAAPSPVAPEKPAAEPESTIHSRALPGLKGPFADMIKKKVSGFLGGLGG